MICHLLLASGRAGTGLSNRKAYQEDHHMIQGSCLCQSITFAISGKMRDARYCHCGNCRKFSGTSPAAWAIAETAKLTVTSSGARISKFNSGRGLRCFCSECGSPIWFESLEHPEIIAIPLGILDTGDIPAPEIHIWTRSKPDWYTITDDLPQYKTYPKQD